MDENYFLLSFGLFCHWTLIILARFLMGLTLFIYFLITLPLYLIAAAALRIAGACGVRTNARNDPNDYWPSRRFRATRPTEYFGPFSFVTCGGRLKCSDVDLPQGFVRRVKAGSRRWRVMRGNRKSIRERLRREPPALPLKRQCTLTGPELHRHSPPQPLSGFLSKLTPDVRLVIYELVLVAGNKRVHVIETECGRRRRRLISYPCVNHFRNHTLRWDTLDGCLEYRDQCLQCERESDYIPIAHKLAIVKVCRQVYIESIDIIYRMSQSYFSSSAFSSSFFQIIHTC